MDAKAFQKSINDELLIVKDRVRMMVPHFLGHA
jgi:hypothetical protein